MRHGQDAMRCMQGWYEVRGHDIGPKTERPDEEENNIPDMHAYDRLQIHISSMVRTLLFCDIRPCFF